MHEAPFLRSYFQIEIQIRSKNIKYFALFCNIILNLTDGGEFLVSNKSFQGFHMKTLEMQIINSHKIRCV